MANERTLKCKLRPGIRLLVIALLISLTACGNDPGKTTPAGTDPQTTGAVSTQEETTVPSATEPDAGQSEAEKALRAGLLAKEEGTIELNEDVTLTGYTLSVSGKKTIKGSGSIQTADFFDEFIITVEEGARLVLDGVTVDGGGQAESGILVLKDAELDFESGEVKNVSRQGIRVAGEAIIKGRVNNVGTNWLDLRDGSTAKLSGACFEKSGSVGIEAAAGAQLTINENTTLSGAAGNILYNSGTAEIEDSVISDSTEYSLVNEGRLTLKNADIGKAASQGLVCNCEGGKLTIEDSSLHDSEYYFLSNSGKAVLKNVAMAGSKNYGVYNEGHNADLSMTGCAIEHTGHTAIFNRVGSRLTADSLTVRDIGGYGVLNRGGDLILRDLTIENTEGASVLNDSATNSDLTYGTLELNGFRLSGGLSYGVVSYGGIMNLMNGTVEACVSSCVYIRSGESRLENVDALGVTGETELPAIQIGNADNTDAVVIMDNVTVSGAYRGITNRGTLTFNSGSICDNHNAGQLQSGGGINNYKMLTINGGTISGNSSVKSGGGIYNQGTLIINDGTIEQNTAGTSGGGICNVSGGQVTMNGGSAVNNRAANNGGGLYNSGTFDLMGGRISSNTSGKLGGGVTNDGYFHMVSGYLYGNKSAEQGGAIFNTSQATAQLSGGKISGNGSGNGKGGGAVYNTGRLTLENYIEIVSNTAEGGGGAINNNCSESGARGTVTIKGGTLTDNRSGASGGVVANNGGILKVTGGTMKNNSAENYGGAIYNDAEGEASLSGAVINGNLAGKSGGAVYTAGKVSLDKMTISGNAARDSKGGAIYAAAGSNISLTNSEVSGNVSASDGPAAYIYTGTLTIKNSTVSGTEAAPAIANYQGSLGLGGKVVLSAQADNGIELQKDFSADSVVSLFMKSYAAGAQVLTGDEAAVKNSFDKAFSLPDAPESVALGDDGRLKEAGIEVPDPEAEDNTNAPPF